MLWLKSSRWNCNVAMILKLTFADGTTSEMVVKDEAHAGRVVEEIQKVGIAVTRMVTVTYLPKDVSRAEVFAKDNYEPQMRVIEGGLSDEQKG